MAYRQFCSTDLAVADEEDEIVVNVLTVFRSMVRMVNSHADASRCGIEFGF